MSIDLETRGYTPETARRLEDREDQLDNLVDISILLSPHVWPHLGDNPGDIRNIVEDVVDHYRWHRERTPDVQVLPPARFVAHYIAMIEADSLGRNGTLAAVWKEHAAGIEPGNIVSAPNHSGVNRKLVCFEPCCLDNPHAEMRLTLHGKDIGVRDSTATEGGHPTDLPESPPATPPDPMPRSPSSTFVVHLVKVNGEFVDRISR